jgi:hypothetical protein
MDGIKLKGALSRNDEHQIRAEAEREYYSLRTYRQALGLNTTEGIRTILESQLTEVQQAHDRIRSLRDSTLKHAVQEEKHAVHEEPVEPASRMPPPGSV